MEALKRDIAWKFVRCSYTKFSIKSVKLFFTYPRRLPTEFYNNNYLYSSDSDREHVENSNFWSLKKLNKMKMKA